MGDGKITHRASPRTSQFEGIAAELASKAVDHFELQVLDSAGVAQCSFNRHDRLDSLAAIPGPQFEVGRLLGTPGAMPWRHVRGISCNTTVLPAALMHRDRLAIVERLDQRTARAHDHRAPDQPVRNRIVHPVDSDVIGLGWGICHVPELKAAVLAIEKKQRQLARVLDPETSRALADDWNHRVDELYNLVGTKWFDSVKEDVAAALEERLRFLDRIDLYPSEGLPGRWESTLGMLSISQDERGGITVDTDALTCLLPPYDSGAIRLVRQGAGLKLTLDRKAYAAVYPSAYGCFPKQVGPSVVDGIYFPVKPSLDGVAP